MASPQQKREACGHLMAVFDNHSQCAHCHEKGKGSYPFVLKKGCPHCNVLSVDQQAQTGHTLLQIEKKKSEIASLTSLTPLLLNTIVPP